MAKTNTIIEAVPHLPEADSFDFHRSWMGVKHACGAHKMVIVLTCVLTILLTGFYVKFWPPVFIAQVALAGESDKDRSRENFYNSWAVFRNDALTDEAVVMTSAPVLAEVVDKLHLTDNDIYHSFFSYLGYRWTISPVGKAYRAFKESIFPSTPSPYSPTEDEIARGRVLRDFKTGVQLDRVMETNIGNLTVRGPSPRVGEIANMIVQVHFDLRRRRQIAEAEAAYDSLKTELDKAQVEVDALEARMRDYYEKNDLLLIFEKDKIDIGQAQTLRAGVIDMQASITATEQTLKQLDIELANEPRDVVSSRTISANPLRDGLKDRLTALQVQRRQTQVNYKPGSPELVDLDKQISIINEQLRQEPDSTLRSSTTVLSSHYEELRGRAARLRADRAGMKANVTAKQGSLDKLEELLRTIPAKMKVVHDFDREHTALEKKLQAINEKMMIAQVSRATAATAPPTIRVVEAASAPAEASWPKTKMLLALAALGGLLAGIGLALLLDLFFGRVHRYRLAGSGWDVPIYAIVQRDRSALRTVYALAAPARNDGRRLTWSQD